MQNNNFEIVKQIQDSADIVAVISQYIKLVPRGSNYFGLCPFHSDNNPSLVVSRKKKIFKCFVCGTKGSVFSFVQKYKKITFFEAVYEVAKAINFDLSKIEFKKGTSLDPKFLRLINANKQAAEWYSGFLTNPENKHAHDYLLNRGISESAIKYFEIGYATKNKNLISNMLSNADEMFGARDPDFVWNEQELIDSGISLLNRNNELNDFFVDRIIFPIRDTNSMLVGFSGRTISNNDVKYLNSSSSKTFNKSNVLYNLNNIKDKNPSKLVVVEGFFDAIAFHCSGVENVVATMGVALTDNQINILSSIKELKTIILSFDNDSAGQHATFQNGKKLLENGFNVFVIDRKDKHKDIDELFQKEGADSVVNAYENSVDFISYMITSYLGKKIPHDEIQVKITEVIGDVIEYGDALYKTKHLKLISDLSGIEIDDINTKFLDLLKKQKKDIPGIPLSQEKNYQAKTEVKFGAESDWIKSQAKINEISYTLTKSLDTLIILMIFYPEHINEIFDRFMQTRSYGNENQLIIIKLIYILHSRNEFSKDKLMQELDRLSKDDNANKYLDASDYLVRLIEDPTIFFITKNVEKIQLSARIDSLLKKISDNRYHIILLEYQIERARLTISDKEKNKNKIDDLSKKIIDLNELRRKKMRGR